MPTEADLELWQTAVLTTDSKLSFDSSSGFQQALNDGFFFVHSPGIDLVAGDRFAESFYLSPQGDDPYRGFSRFTTMDLAERQGYFCRDVDQTEQFFLESRLWERVYPPELVLQATAMRSFALDLLRSLLAGLDLPVALWDEATGRALSGAGTYHLTFNHFRPDVRARGLNVHKDSGWITLLRSIEPGLEVLRNDRWVPIVPRPDHFIVNFGCAMEILMRRTETPVAAVAHRVHEIEPHPSKPDRFSYALFVDSSLDERLCPGLFEYNGAGELELAMSFGDFLDEIVKKTYQPDTQGLY